MKDLSDQDKTFICDDHLGKLARYLRAGGFDTYFSNTLTDSELIRLSLDEHRIILTRDRRLLERRLVRRHLLIESDQWPEQLRQVTKAFNLIWDKDHLFSRCLEDNAVIVSVTKEEVADLVPPYTYSIHDVYRRCPVCGRIFWPGSHTTAILGQLKKAGIL